MRLNDARNGLLDAAALGGADTAQMRELANEFRGATARRAAEPDYVKCPRCWDWHTVWSNFGHLPQEEATDPKLAREKLCDDCQCFILTQHPDHPSVPHIKAALEKWRKLEAKP